LGLYADPRRIGQSGVYNWAHDDCRHAEAPWHRTGAGANRKTTWKEFLRRHWTQIIAADFFTVEVWTCTGLKRFIVLFFIDLSSRRVEIAGIALSPNGLWMAQVARNITDAVAGFFVDKRYLIHDRDPLYTNAFLEIIGGCGIEAVKLPARSPNLNAYAEHFVRTIKEDCLDRMLFSVRTCYDA
jgi:putative transposase